MALTPTFSDAVVWGRAQNFHFYKVPGDADAGGPGRTTAGCCGGSHSGNHWMNE